MSQGFDPQALLAQALEMQQRLVEAQEGAAEQVVEGSAGGGKVTITMTGGGEVTAVHIDRSVVLPDEVDMLEDLVMAALHDAFARAAELAQSQLGFDLGGLGELFGGLVGGGAGGVVDADSRDVLPPAPEQG